MLMLIAKEIVLRTAGGDARDGEMAEDLVEGARARGAEPARHLKLGDPLPMTLRSTMRWS